MVGGIGVQERLENNTCFKSMAMIGRIEFIRFVAKVVMR
jgi:hypothetical protein